MSSPEVQANKRNPQAPRTAMAVALNTIGIWVGRRREDKIRFLLFITGLIVLFGFASYKYMKLSEQSERNSIINTANLLGIKSSMNFSNCNQHTVCAKVERCSDAGVIDQPPMIIKPFDAKGKPPEEDGYYIPREQNVTLSPNGAANLCDLHKCQDGRCQSASFIVIAAGL